MQNCCNHLRLRSKNYKKYLYCIKAKKEIDFETCKSCIFKEFKKYKELSKTPKRDTNEKSIMPNMILLHKENDASLINFIEVYGVKKPYYHKNHIFEGKNRKNSEKYGLFVWMKWDDHIGENSAYHNSIKMQTELKGIAQKQFNKVYPDLDFVKIFGRNYLI